MLREVTTRGARLRQCGTQRYGFSSRCYEYHGGRWSIKLCMIHQTAGGMVSWTYLVCATSNKEAILGGIECTSKNFSIVGLDFCGWFCWRSGVPPSSQGMDKC